MILAVSAIGLVFAQGPNPAALNDAATQHAQAKRFDEAEKLWKRAIELQPAFFPALFNLAFLYFSTSRYDRAEPLLVRSAKLQPDNFNVHYLLGTARVSLGRRDEGLVAWRAALAL